MFWESMQIQQMGQLLLRREQPQLAEGWSELLDALRAYPSSAGATANALSDCPRTPAVYFFTCVAAVCSRCGDPHGLPAVMEQYLPAIETNNQNCLKFADRERSAADCMDWIAQTAAELTQEMELTELLDQLDAAHLRFGGNRARSMRDGLATLRSELSDWDSTCQSMWQALRPGGTAGEICALVERGVRQIILTGAPGTGKTYAAQLAAGYLGAHLDGGMKAGQSYALVPFHPSYDYTDFVEGLRPINRDGSPTFVKLDGAFKAFCRRAAEQNLRSTGGASAVSDPSRRYFFLIDEINRADLSKVFGELMLCLESDKRGVPVTTQYANLPTYDAARQAFMEPEEDLFTDGFFVPENVYILGAMNDIDRSVESMDFALRRRFTWLEVEVTQELLESAFRTNNFCPVLNDRAEDAARRVMALNDVISSLPEEAGRGIHTGWGERHCLNRQYYISQGQFAGLPDPLPREEGDGGDELDALLRFVWKYRLRSLLREYVRGVEEQAETDFLARCRDALLEG